MIKKLKCKCGKDKLLKFDKESGWWCFICIYCGDKTKVDKPTKGKPYHGNLKFRIVR